MSRGSVASPKFILVSPKQVLEVLQKIIILRMRTQPDAIVQGQASGGSVTSGSRKTCPSISSVISLVVTPDNSQKMDVFMWITSCAVNELFISRTEAGFALFNVS